MRESSLSKSLSNGTVGAAAAVVDVVIIVVVVVVDKLFDKRRCSTWRTSDLTSSKDVERLVSRFSKVDTREDSNSTSLATLETSVPTC